MPKSGNLGQGWQRKRQAPALLLLSLLLCPLVVSSIAAAKGSTTSGDDAIGVVTTPPPGANYTSGAEYPTGPMFARFRVYQTGWTAPQYDAQQILSMISQLHPDVLERMTTGTFNVSASVPVCSGCPPMDYGQFLNASMTACGCYVIPRLDINSTWTAGTFLSDAQQILNTPVFPRFAMLSIDNWGAFCSKVESCTCALAQQVFQPLYAMGWKGVGVLNAESPYYSTCGWATFVDLDGESSNWMVPQTLLSSIKSDQTVQKILLYDPDFPGQASQFLSECNPTCDSVISSLRNVVSQQTAQGYSYVYPIEMPNWDANQILTSTSGPYQGQTLFQIFQGWTDDPGLALNTVQSTSETVSSAPYQITLTNFSSGTGSDQLLVVGVAANDYPVSSITFGGAQLTKAVGSFHNNDAEFWSLRNPSGIGNIVVTMAGPTSVVVGAYSFSGVSETSPIPTTAASHNKTPSSPSISITTKYPGSWILDLPSIYGGVALRDPTCTQQWDANMPSAITSASSSDAVLSPITVTCGWTASSSDLWDDVAVEVGAPTSSSQLTIKTQATGGSTINGLYTVLSQDNKTVATGYSPVSFTVTNGELYVVGVDDYASHYFQYWQDTGSVNQNRTVMTSSNLSLTAVICDGPPGTCPNPTPVDGITVYANRIQGSWAPCFATACSAGTGPGASMYFELENSAGKVLQAAYSNEQGYTFSGLSPGTTYYVDATSCDSCQGAGQDVVFEHWGNDTSTVDPLPAGVGAALDAWYSCINGCSGEQPNSSSPAPAAASAMTESVMTGVVVALMRPELDRLHGSAGARENGYSTGHRQKVDRARGPGALG